MTDKILLNHGSGGKLTQKLIRDLFLNYFDNPVLKGQTDSAILKVDSQNIAFTTDTYVVSPVFFPGGDIGKLAVCGTINDLSVSGAKPLYLSCGFIIEEGMPFAELEEITKSMATAAHKAGVIIVTGDTKVVDRGKADKVFINTSGIGILEEKNLGISFGTDIKPGDKIIINGFVGDHGTAILCARNNLEYQTEVVSDCAPLNLLIGSAIKAGRVKFMRDATRGGLATILCELAEKQGFDIEIKEKSIPVRENVRGLCEVFGFDPIYMANEGKVVMIVSSEDADNIVENMKKCEFGEHTAIIGQILETKRSRVIQITEIGGQRIVDMHTGEQLPRIC